MADKSIGSDVVDDTNAIPNITIENNRVVGFHYRLCEVDSEGAKGKWFEESKNKGLLYYLHGYHNVVIGLERALEGKKIGDRVEITLKPGDAYGDRDPAAILRVPLKKLQTAYGIKRPRIGGLVRVRSTEGWRNGIVLKPGKFHADVDFNHPLSGRVLHYEVEVDLIREASEEEIAKGRPLVPNDIVRNDATSSAD